MTGVVARRGPGRPPDPGIAERRRRELVEAAYNVFARKGYASSGVGDIVDELGVGRGTFYRYFATKRDIVDSVLDYSLTRLQGIAFGPESMVAVAGDPGDVVAMLRTAMDRTLTVLEVDPGLARVFVDLSGVDDDVIGRVITLGDNAAKATKWLLDSAVTIGAVRSDLDTDVAARICNAALSPAMIEAVAGTLTEPKRELYLETIVAIVTTGILDPR